MSEKISPGEEGEGQSRALPKSHPIRGRRGGGGRGEETKFAKSTPSYPERKGKKRTIDFKKKGQKGLRLTKI